MNEIIIDTGSQVSIDQIKSVFYLCLEAANSLPKAEPRPCGCGCGETVAFPWKYRQGHQLRKGKRTEPLKVEVATKQYQEAAEEIKTGESPA